MKYYFPRTMMLSTALSLASLGGTLGQCAMAGPDRDPIYQKSAEAARFCYQTLGEISCFAAPQPNLGPVVALEPEKIPDEDAVPASIPAPAVAPATDTAPPAPALPPVSAPPPVTSPAVAPTATSKPKELGVPASMAPDYPKPRTMPTPDAPVPLTSDKAKQP